MHNYLNLLKTIKHAGQAHKDRTEVGTTSLFGYQFGYDLIDGFPLLTTKQLSFRWIAEELFWFLSGSTHVDDLRNRCKNPITIWDDWASAEQCAKFGRPEGELGPIYGKQWRSFGASTTTSDKRWWSEENRRWVNYGYADDGFDQIRALCDSLESEQGRRSRRLIVSSWHPVEANEVSLPPCHTLFHVKWHEDTNTLDLQLYQRSADVFLGVPYNIASYALLLHLLCAAGGFVPGRFIHTFGDVHIYNTHRDVVDQQLSRTPRALPDLEITVPPGATLFDRLLNFTWESLTLTGYDPHPRLEAPVAV